MNYLRVLSAVGLSLMLFFQLGVTIAGLHAGQYGLVLCSLLIGALGSLALAGVVSA